MLKRSRFLFVLFLLLVEIHRVLPAQLFKLTELGLPPGLSSEPTAINEHGAVVGYLDNAGGNSVAFLWSGGQLQFLPGFEGASQALGLNDLGHVVGRSKIDGLWTAWLHQDGQDVALDPGESSAVAINNSGAVIGNVADNGFLLRPDRVLLTCCTGGPMGPSPGEVVDINSASQVLGHFDKSGFLLEDLQNPEQQRFLQWETAEPYPVLRYGTGFALNSSSVVAGSFRYALSVEQAALWENGFWLPLGAPLEESSVALDINDHRLAVGHARRRELALLWQGNIGLDLDSVVDLPPGARLISAVAINNSSQIAATLLQNGTSRAVLLDPVSNSIHLPDVRMDEPFNNTALFQSDFVAQVRLLPSDLPLQEARFYLHSRRRTDPAGLPPLSWTPTTYWSNPFRTNLSSPENLSKTIFSNVPPGQYAASAEVLVDGMRLHLPPIFFALSQPPRLQTYRVNFDSRLEFGLHGSPGWLHDIEASTDLRNWTVLQQDTEGGLFSLPTQNTNLLVLRTRSIQRGTNFFGRIPSISSGAPVSLANRFLNFRSHDNQTRFDFHFAENTFTAASGLEEFEGTYSYSTSGFIARLRAIDPRDPAWTFDAQLEFPLESIDIFDPLSPAGNFRATTQFPGNSQTVTGDFTYRGF